MPDSSPKLTRLAHKTYLQLIRNSVGTGMFRNFYVHSEDKGEFDALDGGSNSCAFYVSGVLVLFQKITRVHGTVDGLLRDLESSGWQAANEPRPGDIIVWETMDFADGRHAHIGFYLGEGRAVSTSWTEKVVVEHDLRFGEANRPISRIYHLEEWRD